MDGKRPLGLALLAAGLLVVTALQAAAPVVSPLFDGVVVAEPYRYLDPPAGGAGSPTSADKTVAVADTASPAFAVFTEESPPQAELLAHGGELAIRADSSSMHVTIEPIPAPATNAPATIAGNVYRFTVTDQSGANLAALAGQTITLAMRGPDGVSADASIARFENGAWQPLTTGPSGLPNLFISNVTAFGEFAIIGSAPAPPSDESPLLLIVALVIAAVIAFFGLRQGGVPRLPAATEPQVAQPAPNARRPARRGRR